MSKPRIRRSRARRPQAEPLESRSLLSLAIVVNTANDEDNLDFSQISLREAIKISNGEIPLSAITNAGNLVSGLPSSPSFGSPPDPNQIYFALPYATPEPSIVTIQVTGSALPAITQPVSINGFTQAGSSISAPDKTEVVANSAMVRLDGSLLGGSLAGPSYDGLTINASNCEVSGLIVTGFSGVGLAIANPGVGFAAQGNWIWGNFFGALPDPTSGRYFSNDPVSMFYGGNPQPSMASGIANLGGGIRITASNNRVGGNTPGLPNVIANNGFDATGAPALGTGNGLGVGILIDAPTGTGNLIQGNAILHNAQEGVYVRSSNNTIGEALAGGGNVIGGNLGDGVRITGGPTVQGNRLLGNWIGTELGTIDGKVTKGQATFSNDANGIYILDSPRNTIGGLTPASRNVIGRNALDGVRITGDNAQTNRILGNYIGFNIVNGAIVFLPNQNGVYITSPGNFVGDATPGAANTISNNRGHGVLIAGAAASGNTIAGNVIGLNPDGGSAFGNGFDGIHIDNAPNTLIGGTTTDARNTISSNNNGIVVEGLVTADPADNHATGTRIYGNFIGTAVDGLTDLGNAVDGVVLRNAPKNLIGDALAGAGNVISGNNRGVRVEGAASRDNQILRNFIGTDLLANALIHNEVDGILVTGGASNNTIGSLKIGEGNTILNNVGAGVYLDGGTSNATLGNAIYLNNGRGLAYPSGGDLGAGIYLNPANGSNLLQVAPTLTSVTPTGGSTHVAGTFHGAPNGVYTFQYFSSPSKDASGHGQGLVFLGSYKGTTDGLGDFKIDQQLALQVAAGSFISATVTDSQGNTSSFSNDLPAVPITLQFAAPSYSVNASQGAMTVTVTRIVGVQGESGGDVSVQYSTTDGTAAAGVDYTSVAGTLFFHPNDPDSQTFTIPILNSGKLSGSGTVNLTLSAPANGATLGAPATATLTIAFDALPSVGLAASALSVSETAGNATFVVTRNTNQGTTTVNYATADGTAVAGVNYAAASGTLTFAPNEVSKTIVVPILPDNTVTGPLTFGLSLSSPVNGQLGATSSATVTMLDTDAPGSLGVTTPSVIAQPGAAFANVIVARTGGVAGTVSVRYTTTGGNAVPGTDYTPTNGVLTFGPGETTKTIAIPLLNTSAPIPDTSFNLFLSAPTGGATLGRLNSAVVIIKHPASGSGGGGTVPTETVPPTIVDFTPMAGPQGVYAVVLTFSEALDPNRAMNLDSYGHFIATPGYDGQFGTYDDGWVEIAAVAYDASARRVILALGAPIPLGSFGRLTISRDAGIAPGRGLTDLAGNFLDGSGSGYAPGTPFVVIFGAGSQLRYNDASGDLVNLKLTGGGLMTLLRGANGEAQQLRIAGAPPRVSVLSGSVQAPRRGLRASTIIPSITGAAGVRIQLRRPSFVLGGISAMAVDRLAATNRLQARR